MNEELVAQFVEQVKADCGDSGFCGASGDAEGMLQLELTVHESLMRLGRETVRRLVQEIGTGHLGSEVNHEGQAYRFKGYRPKTVHGLYGAVRILRAYYATGSGSGWAPLDEQLEIGDGQTPGCAPTIWPCSSAASRTRAGAVTSTRSFAPTARIRSRCTRASR